MSKQLDNSRRTGRLRRRPAFRPQAEGLEARSLLSSINNTLVWFTMPLPTTAPPNGSRIGVIHTDTSGIASALTPNPPVAVPGSNPVGITIGPDNTNLWVTESALSQVQEISPSGTVLLTVPLPAGSGPEGITVGPDGNLWVALNTTSFIDMITPAGVVTPFALPAGSGPEGITSSGGFLYATLNTTDFIDQISTAGVITPIALPAGSAPAGITAGPNNTVWFTETGAAVNDIGEITATNTAAPVLTTAAFLKTSGKVNPANYVPVGIAEGSDGNIWFTMQVTAAGVAAGRLPRIGVIHPNTGVVNSENISAGPGAANWVPVSTTAGPDGNVWFTMRNTVGQPDRIGVVNPTTSVINSAALPVGTFLAANDTLPFGIYGLFTPDPPATSAPLMNRSNSLLASG